MQIFKTSNISYAWSITSKASGDVVISQQKDILHSWKTRQLFMTNDFFTNPKPCGHGAQPPHIFAALAMFLLNWHAKFVVDAYKH